MANDRYGGVTQGDAIPALTLTGIDGATIPLDDASGRQLVLFFFPKADTPGCTTEAIDFSTLADAFAAAGARVIGVSRDSPDRLARFADKHKLTITLGSDDGPVSEAFGTWGEKRLYGRTYLGLERATFLFGADGRLRREWRKVRVAGHAAAVLTAVKDAD